MKTYLLCALLGANVAANHYLTNRAAYTEEKLAEKVEKKTIVAEDDEPDMKISAAPIRMSY